MNPSASIPGLGDIPLADIAKDHPSLMAEFRRLSLIQTAATFSGLLTLPELQANCLRLQALVHFAVSYCEGHDAPTRGFILRAFESVGDGYCGMAEDPAENVFVALVNTPKGNFRVFEGIREGTAFHLQRILNIVDGMPQSTQYGKRLRNPS